MSVARYYRADKNSGGGEFPGVPLRDIEDEEWAVLPEWLQASVDASEIYQKTKPTASKPADTSKET